MVPNYDPASTLLSARDHYFAANGFPPDGGYDDDFVDFKLGPIPFPFPNTRGRKRAVPYHDLHHVVTGYDTNFRGELEIAAWELGAGCRDFLAAWFLNLGGTAMGALIAPRRTFRAFVRGRRTRSLYRDPLPSLLRRSVGEVRRDLGLDQPSRARASDYFWFSSSYVAGSVLGLVFLASGALLPLISLTTVIQRKRAHAR
jgi:hypothetical protein